MNLGTHSDHGSPLDIALLLVGNGVRQPCWTEERHTTLVSVGCWSCQLVKTPLSPCHFVQTGYMLRKRDIRVTVCQEKVDTQTMIQS